MATREISHLSAAGNATTTQSLGRVGEAIVFSWLVENVVPHVFIVDAPGCDLIVLLPGRALRVEVKASNCYQGVKGKKYYKFTTRRKRVCWDAGAQVYKFMGAENLSNANCDVVALVSLGSKNIEFVPVSDIATQVVRRPEGAFSSPSLSTESWRRIRRVFNF